MNTVHLFRFHPLPSVNLDFQFLLLSSLNFLLLDQVHRYRNYASLSSVETQGTSNLFGTDNRELLQFRELSAVKNQFGISVSST